MSGPSIYFGLPDASLFKVWPDAQPPALPPPNDVMTVKAPFAISPEMFNAALEFRVPATIASVYAVSVLLINVYNRRNGNKPWRISKTRAFKVFVILHNILLAVYSGVTFAAMSRAMDRVWPGFDNPNGLAGVADALCKIHGPGGFGDAITYNTSTTAWQAKNSLVKLLPAGTPDPTDVGRMWNEGLAFWGWWFYLSKFYEVLDTFVIVAKGKRSATLQTYHHAGAMLCMWAGIRYMSPPIWMFVWVNSGIHTLMYTYFTLSALGIRVPIAVKRTLTTMQITQFLFGATFAAVHLFVKYDIPILTAFKVTHPVSSMLSAASSTASTIAASATSAAASATLPDSPLQTYGTLLKRLLLRAAGEEGVAENVREIIGSHGSSGSGHHGLGSHHNYGDIALDGAREAQHRVHEEIRYRNDYTPVNCIDTTGQAFAIWLNLIYLAPLTLLFVRFFIRAYSGRSKAAQNAKRASISRAEKSTVDAIRDVDREIEDKGKKVEKFVDDETKHLSDEVARDIKAMRDGKLGKKVGDAKNSAANSIDNLQKKAANSASNSIDNLQKKAANSAPNSIDSLQKKAANSASNSIDNLQKKAANSASSSIDSLQKTAANSIDGLQKKAARVIDGAADEASRLADGGRPGTSGSAESGETTSSPSTPNKKKRKNKGKNKTNASTESLPEDEDVEDVKDGVEKEEPDVEKKDTAGKDTETAPSAETAKVKQEEDGVEEKDTAEKEIDTTPSAETAKFKEGESFADAVKAEPTSKKPKA